MEITVKGETSKLITPTGKEIILESVCKQDIAFSYDSRGMESVTKQGSEYRVCRFYPDEAGTYCLESGDDKTCITVQEDPNAHGFIEVSKKDPRYFDYEKQADSASYDDDIYRKFNKRLYKGTEPCKTVTEWLEDDFWQNAWLHKVRELAKRLNGDTTVFGIELWNEMNTLSGVPFEVTVEWNKKMLPEVKKLFPNHLVMNSLGSCDSEGNEAIYKKFCWEKSDIRQMHRYLDQGAENILCKTDPIKLIYTGVKALAEMERRDGRA